jgi:hypothetical protein
MAEVGLEERFPPARLSGGSGFRKGTIAGMRRNGRDAETGPCRDREQPKDSYTGAGKALPAAVPLRNLHA